MRYYTYTYAWGRDWTGDSVVIELNNFFKIKFLNLEFLLCNDMNCLE